MDEYSIIGSGTDEHGVSHWIINHAPTGNVYEVACSEDTVTWLGAQLNTLARLQARSRSNGKTGGRPARSAVVHEHIKGLLED
jgi:hypothetical protein